jgi:uncharacterized protein (DUF3820 family)
MAVLTTDPRIEKLLRLALDPAAPDGEAKAAALRILHLARTAGVTAEQVLAGVSAVPGDDDSDDVESCPWWEDVVLPFGKYKGETIGDVMRENPGYIRWCAENLNFTTSRGSMDALSAALRFMEGT